MRTYDLAAAGIDDPQLRASYERCRALNAAHGKTYYLATLLLPRWKRPYVHALYGFARYADEIVDDLSSTASIDEKRALLRTFGADFLRDLDRGSSSDPVCMAVVDTVQRWDIAPEHFVAFLHSMEMDLSVTSYATYDDLCEYTYGSAAVIGLQMVPILEPLDESAYAAAQDLGTAFQLANFIRDVGEDLDRGRVYLPEADMAACGVTRADLEHRVVTPAIRELLAFEIHRVRELETQSLPGIAALAPSSRPCIEAARILYCGIVDAVEAIDYQVFDQRATVPLRRRLTVAGSAYLRSKSRRPVRR